MSVFHTERPTPAPPPRMPSAAPKSVTLAYFIMTLRSLKPLPKVSPAWAPTRLAPSR